MSTNAVMKINISLLHNILLLCVTLEVEGARQRKRKIGKEYVDKDMNDLHIKLSK